MNWIRKGTGDGKGREGDGGERQWIMEERDSATRERKTIANSSTDSARLGSACPTGDSRLFAQFYAIRWRSEIRLDISMRRVGLQLLGHETLRLCAMGVVDWSPQFPFPVNAPLYSLYE